jgi:hypothetical protein
MRFDSRYATYNMVAAMAEAAGLMPAVPGDSSDTSSAADDTTSGDESRSSDEV